MTESYGVQSATLTLDGLFAGDFPVMTQAITLAADSGALARGTVLGLTSAGLAAPYDPDASDGSETAALILADDIAVGASDVQAVAYRTGCFRRGALAGIDDAAVAALDARSIFVR